MVAELCFDGSDNLSLLSFEACLLELRDHFALAEPAKVSALGFTGAFGKPLCEVGEVLSVGEADHDSLCVSSVGDEDVRSVN